jgi:hypothetical protein
MRYLIALVLAWTCAAFAQAPKPAPAVDVAWPREVKAPDGTRITVYQPQAEQWADNVLTGRAAVSVLPPGMKEPSYGVIELSARTEIDKSADLVTLSGLRITKTSFPGAAEQEVQKYVAALRAAVTRDRWPLSAQALQANLAVVQARSKQKALPVKNDPPQILFRTEPSMLVLVDGEPVLRDVKEAPGMQRVINSSALILLEKASANYYLRALGRWWEAKSVTGEWKQGPLMLASLEKAREALDKQYDPLEGKDAEGKPVFEPGVAPRIIIATAPTELLQSKGEPKFTPIPRTQLLYMSNSSNDIFMDVAGQTYYVLISGRWFSAKALAGPWAFVSPKALPADFAKIPPEHQIADVLASVPNTPQAREAAIANQIPQTSTVQRDVQPTPVVYDGGAPQWKPIDGTPLHYAYNTGVPVIQVDPKTYFMAQNGVWFSATAAGGPWAVAVTVPSVIYTIPANSPLHYVTYVRVYSSTPSTVFVGYTPGYYGTVLSSDGVVVYGTGYYYPPYIGAVYYPPPYYTYGYGAGFTVGFFFGFAMGGGWYGPCCYGGGGVYVSHHNNISVNNSYNRWGGKSTSISGPGGRNVQATQVGNTTLAKGSGSNNVYAGRDGNVYRRDEGGNWQQHQKGEGWQDVGRQDRPGAETRPATRDQASTRDQAATRNQAATSDLNRQAQSRDVGAQRAQQYRSAGGHGGFQGGGGMRGGGGGGRGGGRR